VFAVVVAVKVVILISIPKWLSNDLRL